MKFSIDIFLELSIILPMLSSDVIVGAMRKYSEILEHAL